MSKCGASPLCRSPLRCNSRSCFNVCYAVCYAVCFIICYAVHFSPYLIQFSMDDRRFQHIVQKPVWDSLSYLCGSNIRFYPGKIRWNKEPGEIFCLLQALYLLFCQSPASSFQLNTGHRAVTPHPRPGRPPYIVLTFLNQNICFHNSAESQLRPHVRCHHWLHTLNWYFSYPSYNNLILSCSKLIRVLN